MGSLESRYAEALLSLAKSPDEADQIGDTLTAFSSLFRNNAELNLFLLNPVIARRVKKEVIQKLIEKDAPHVLSFLSLLVDKNRLHFLPGMLQDYNVMKTKMRQILQIVVRSVEPLPTEQLTAIKEKYITVYGAKSAQIVNETDPSLMGGICIQIGDVRIDDTLLNRLNGLKEALIAI